jgi:hypothetical protein
MDTGAETSRKFLIQKDIRAELYWKALRLSDGKWRSGKDGTCEIATTTWCRRILSTETSHRSLFCPVFRNHFYLPLQYTVHLFCPPLWPNLSDVKCSTPPPPCTPKLRGRDQKIEALSKSKLFLGNVYKKIFLYNVRKVQAWTPRARIDKNKSALRIRKTASRSFQNVAALFSI